MDLSNVFPGGSVVTQEGGPPKVSSVRGLYVRGSKEKAGVPAVFTMMDVPSGLVGVLSVQL